MDQSTLSFGKVMGDAASSSPGYTDMWMCRGEYWEWLCSICCNKALYNLMHCNSMHLLLLDGQGEKGETRTDALRDMNAELCW